MLSSAFVKDVQYRYWNEDHIGRYLLSNGEDLPGNFQLGDQTHLRLRRSIPSVRREDYSDLADRIMSGELPGSSVGGEQPKFTAFSDDLNAHIIVKFSPRGDNPVAHRWRDILVSECHASETLRACGLPSARYQLVEGDERLFLETPRFDRSGMYGRSSMISLQYVDVEFTAEGAGWSRVMQALHEKNLVSLEDAHTTRLLEGFGRLINNTDMHLGNLSLSMEGDSFNLLPDYDMCSMGFAPKGGGEVLPFSFAPQRSASYSA